MIDEMFQGKTLEDQKVKEFSRPINLCKQVVILDGLTGTGKTMFTPLL